MRVNEGNVIIGGIHVGCAFMIYTAHLNEEERREVGMHPIGLRKGRFGTRPTMYASNYWLSNHQLLIANM